MAWSILPREGSKRGPCSDACRHIDCADVRRMAQEVCPGCRKRIGYGWPYLIYDGVLWHYVCAEDAAEAARTQASS